MNNERITYLLLTRAVYKLTAKEEDELRRWADISNENEHLYNQVVDFKNKLPILAELDEASNNIWKKIEAQTDLKI